jgi:hypothetical protein
MRRLLVSVFVLGAVTAGAILAGSTGPTARTPLDDLPPWMELLSDWGQRPEWSRDGRYVYFTARLFGDVFRVDVATKKVEPITTHFPNAGFERVFCLSNGDLLLGGAREYDARDPSRQRHKLEMFVLRPDRVSPPVSLDEFCDEGPAVSRSDLRVAWATPGQKQICTGEIAYENGTPKLAGKTVVMEVAGKFDHLETQDFRPPSNEELIVTRYFGGPEKRPFLYSQVLGLDLKTKKETNYTNLPGTYNEAEGMFPDGKSTLVESDRHKSKRFWGVDLYRLALDGSGQVERLTHFSDVPGYIGDNGVVSPDGKRMIVQVGIPKRGAGQGSGLVLFDLEKYAARTR